MNDTGKLDLCLDNGHKSRLDTGDPRSEDSQYDNEVQLYRVSLP
jgi:hypothetical protein